jgi:hypothetical protein
MSTTGTHSSQNGKEDTIEREHKSTNLDRFATNGSISVPMDVFEKMYLNPETRVKGELRKTFGNPTPLSVSSNPEILVSHN